MKAWVDRKAAEIAKAIGATGDIEPLKQALYVAIAIGETKYLGQNLHEAIGAEIEGTETPGPPIQ